MQKLSDDEEKVKHYYDHIWSDFYRCAKSNEILGYFNFIGETKGKKLVIKDDKKIVFDLGLDTLRHQWKNPIWDIMD